MSYSKYLGFRYKKTTTSFGTILLQLLAVVLFTVVDQIHHLVCGKLASGEI